MKRFVAEAISVMMLVAMVLLLRGCNLSWTETSGVVAFALSFGLMRREVGHQESPKG